jgi:histidyl-tRNA synthetase
MEESLLPYYHRLAEDFRKTGLAVEVYPVRRKLSAQFAYAEKRGIPLAVICGELERRAGVVTLKDLRTRRSRENLNPEAATAAAAEWLR